MLAAVGRRSTCAPGKVDQDRAAQLLSPLTNRPTVPGHLADRRSCRRGPGEDDDIGALSQPGGEPATEQTAPSSDDHLHAIAPLTSRTRTRCPGESLS